MTNIKRTGDDTHPFVLMIHSLFTAVPPPTLSAITLAGNAGVKPAVPIEALIPGPAVLSCTAQLP